VLSWAEDNRMAPLCCMHKWKLSSHGEVLRINGTTALMLSGPRGNAAVDLRRMAAYLATH